MPIGDARSTYTDSTLMKLTKPQLIDIIRVLEKNYDNCKEELERAYEWRPVELRVFHHKLFKEAYDNLHKLSACINENTRGYRHVELTHCIAELKKSLQKLKKDTEVKE